MSKRVAILQSNYIPWKGYFDLIASVDEFILYDDMQFTKRDWRNRNKIKTPQGTAWLTVPVKVKGRYHQTIRETEIDGADWQRMHWRALEQNYSKATHFMEIATVIEPFFFNREYSHLSDLNRGLIEAICGYLGIGTAISDSAAYDLSGNKSERLASICVQAGADVYISGPAAKAYIDAQVFQDRSVKVQWINYSRYLVYPQLWGDFIHEVSILDLLFNCGLDARRHLHRDIVS